MNRRHQVMAWAACVAIAGSLAGCCLSPAAPLEEHPDAGPVDGGMGDAGLDDGGGCSYPTGDTGYALGQVFPYVRLGTGFLNLDGSPDSADAGPTTATDVLLRMHCSGSRYVLIDLSTAWCVRSETLARSLVRAAPRWLDAGGLILTVLEEGLERTDGGSPATDSDLSHWVKTFGTNYSLVNDPTENIEVGANVTGWPTLVILDLATMRIVEVHLDWDEAFLDHYSSLLGLLPDGG